MTFYARRGTVFPGERCPRQLPYTFGRHCDAALFELTVPLETTDTILISQHQHHVALLEHGVGIWHFVDDLFAGVAFPLDQEKADTEPVADVEGAKAATEKARWHRNLGHTHAAYAGQGSRPGAVADSNRHGPFSAKAVGEPPFLLGLGAYTAVLACIRAANPDAALPYQLPMTPEKALLALYPRKPC